MNMDSQVAGAGTLIIIIIHVHGQLVFTSSLRLVGLDGVPFPFFGVPVSFCVGVCAFFLGVLIFVVMSFWAICRSCSGGGNAVQELRNRIQEIMAGGIRGYAWAAGSRMLLTITAKSQLSICGRECGWQGTQGGVSIRLGFLVRGGAPSLVTSVRVAGLSSLGEAWVASQSPL